MNNILTAIKTKLTGSALSTAVGGRVYLDRALPGAAFPYVVYFVVSAVPEDDFKRDGESTLIQFSLFSASTSPVEVSGLFDQLKTLFDDCTLTITGNTLVWCIRRGLQTMTEEITVGSSGAQSVKHWAVDYEIITQET